MQAKQVHSSLIALIFSVSAFLSHLNRAEAFGFPIEGSVSDICMRFYEDYKIFCSDEIKKENADPNLLRAIYFYIRELRPKDTDKMHIQLTNSGGPILVTARRDPGNRQTLYFNKEAAKTLPEVVVSHLGRTEYHISYNNELFKQLATIVGDAETMQSFIQRRFGIQLVAKDRPPLKPYEVTPWVRLLLDLPAELLQRRPYSAIKKIIITQESAAEKIVSSMKIRDVVDADPIEVYYNAVDICQSQDAKVIREYSDVLYDVETAFNRQTGLREYTLPQGSRKDSMLPGARARWSARKEYMFKFVENDSMVKDCAKVWPGLSEKIQEAISLQTKSTVFAKLTDGYKFFAYLPLNQTLVLTLKPSVKNMELSALAAWMTVAPFSKQISQKKSLYEFFRLAKPYDHLAEKFEFSPAEFTNQNHYIEIQRELVAKTKLQMDQLPIGQLHQQINFIDSLVTYMNEPEKLKTQSKEAFNFIFENIFSQVEYFTQAAANLKIYINSSRPDVNPPTLTDQISKSLTMNFQPITEDESNTHIASGTLSGITDDITGVSSVTVALLLNGNKETTYYINQKSHKDGASQLETRIDLPSYCKTSCGLTVDHIFISDRGGNEVIVTPDKKMSFSVSTSHITYIKKTKKEAPEARSTPVQQTITETVDLERQIKLLSHGGGEAPQFSFSINGLKQKISSLVLEFDLLAPNSAQPIAGTLKYSLSDIDLSQDASSQRVDGFLKLSAKYPKGTYVLKRVAYRFKDSQIIYESTNFDSQKFKLTKTSGAELMVPSIDFNQIKLTSETKIVDGLEYFKILVNLPGANATVGSVSEIDATLISPTHKKFETHFSGELKNQGANVVFNLPPNPERGFYILSNVTVTTRFSREFGFDRTTLDRFHYGELNINNNTASYDLTTRGIKVNLEGAKK